LPLSTEGTKEGGAGGCEKKLCFFENQHRLFDARLQHTRKNKNFFLKKRYYIKQ